MESCKNLVTPRAFLEATGVGLEQSISPLVSSDSPGYASLAGKLGGLERLSSRLRFYGAR